MSDFAKMFQTELGQVVAMLMANDEDDMPEIRFFYQPEGLDVCSMAFGYKSGDWSKAEERFSKVDMDMALKAAKQIREVAL